MSKKHVAEVEKSSFTRARASMSTIDVWCRFDEAKDITTIVPNPRNPNTHGDKQIALLAKIIRHQGWRQPITVSNRSGFIVKGHGRLQAAKMLQVEQVPVEFQDYATEADEYADLIADNRIAELADVDNAMMIGLLADEAIFDGFDMDLTGFDEDALGELMPDDNGENQLSDDYSHKINAPVYEPKGDKPPIEELYNSERTNELICSINQANIPGEIKSFLNQAAQRHTVFDYGKIAEFYCHADKETQSLMEDSALIIIDFKKALQHGYVKLKDSIMDALESECKEDDSDE